MCVSRKIEISHAKASLASSSTSGTRGRCTKETRIKLMIISSSHEPYFPKRTSCQPFL